MKRYFNYLWLALIGRDPYKDEITELCEQLNRTEADVRSLQDQYCAALQKWEKAAKLTKDYEQLTENLRQHIMDKDVLIQQMKEDYQKRILQYMSEIEALREKEQGQSK